MSIIERKNRLELIGWREWVGLPDLGAPAIKAKVDTGARSSSLHVSDVGEYEENGVTMVSFEIHPVQRSNKPAIRAVAPLLEHRSVRSSSGKAQIRPVIKTTVSLLSQVWQVELTLANRDEMGFRMLLGREAFRDRFLVDAGKSFYGEKPEKSEGRRRKENTLDYDSEVAYFRTNAYPIERHLTNQYFRRKHSQYACFSSGQAKFLTFLTSS